MTEDQSSESHKQKDHKTTSITKQEIAFAIILISFIVAAASAWMLVGTYSNVNQLQDSRMSLLLEASALKSEAYYHKSSLASHRTAILMESVKDAETKDVSTKRLALSIAMAKNGTGFEDRLMERIRQNASDDELNSMRTSFLISLFENYPPALKGQEGIQMQMDAVIIELRAAGMALGQSDLKLKETAELSAQIKDKQEYAKNLWRSLILSILIALFLGAYRPNN
ncbi:MAG: hypothetical protein AABX47_06085 [Nanoarchaeota archaeon]